MVKGKQTLAWPEQSGVKFFENNMLYDVPNNSLLPCLYLGAEQTQPLLHTAAAEYFSWSRMRSGVGFLRF